MTSKTKCRLPDLERNDVKGAMEFVRQERVAGRWNEYLAEMVVMLQDDPEEILKAMAKEP